MAPIYLDFFTAPPKSKWVVIFTITLIVEVLFMLRNFESHTSYQENLKLHLLLFWETDRGRVTDMEKSISKLYLLNLDPLLPIIKPLYSNTGCPAKNQLGIIRSLILMLDQKHHGITSWANMEKPLPSVPTMTSLNVYGKLLIKSMSPGKRN